MTSSSPHASRPIHARRRTWVLTQLATKYPWLRVDSETIEEFRSPFQWVRDGDDAPSVNADDSSSQSSADDDDIQSHSGDDTAPRDTRRRRRHRTERRYSLASVSPHARHAKANERGRNRSPQQRRRGVDRRRQRPDIRLAKARDRQQGEEEDVTRRVVTTLTPAVEPVVQTARSETEAERTTEAGSALPALTTTQLPTDVRLPLPRAVYADLQALKADQRKRQHAKATATKATKAHNYLSLSFPVLHKSTQLSVSTAPSLPQQLALLNAQEATLHAALHRQIEQHKAALPLTFLFARNVDQTYCKRQCVATITAIVAKLQHRRLFDAFGRWRAVRDAEREQERRAAAFQRTQRKALALLERLASDAYVGTLAQALTRWRLTTQHLVAAEAQAAAIKIQGLFRQRRARVYLRNLKQASLDREYKRAMELHRLLAFERYGTAMKWRTLQHGFNLVRLGRGAILITLFFRRVRTIQRIARRVQRTHAAVVIQCRWRMKLAWLTRQRLVRAREIQRDRERAATVHVQRRARGYLARQHAALRRVQLSHTHTSATVLQRAWRRHHDRQCLRDRFAKRRAMLDAEQAQRDGLVRIEAVRRDDARRHAVAVDLQRVARGFLGRRVAKRRRDARALERAVRKVQHAWRTAKGRRALAVRFAAQRERLMQRRLTAALLLQCRVRVLRATRQRDALRQERHRRRASAVAIQRVARGRHARRHFEATRRATVTIQSAWRGKQARDELTRRRHAQELKAQQRYAATLRIQCAARGFAARRLTRQLRLEQQRMAQLLQQSAVLIQKRARGIEARKVAALLRDTLQVVDQQQRRAYANSLQRYVIESSLLAFVTQQSLATATDSSRDDNGSRYSREQLQLIQWQLDAARQQMAREDRAVVCLQRRFRGYTARVEFVVLQLRQRERRALEIRTARTLQRVARGFLARRRVRTLRTKQRGEALKETYIRERRWKDQERTWQEQYRQEQMTLQLQRLQTLEAARRDAKRDAEVAKWEAEAAAARTQALRDELEAKTLARKVRGVSSEGEEDDDDEVKGDEGTLGDWTYVADAYGNWYYYNATTGESAWEKPVVVLATEMENEKKPKKIKTTSQKKTDATTTSKPTASKATQEKPTTEATIPAVAEDATAQVSPIDAVVPEGFCCKCKAVAADKECLDCLLPDDLTRDVLFCHACFTLEHNLLASDGKGRHDFRVVRPLQRPSVCQHVPCRSSSSTSPAKASYYCSACPSTSRFSCEACFPPAHDTAQTMPHIPTALHFRAGALRCVECTVVLAQRTCTKCDEAFCAACFTTLHATPRKRDHEFTPLEILKDDLVSEKDAYCVDCEIRRATRLCNLCGDGFCDACFERAHAKGQKVQHTWIAWDRFATHGDWLEITDDATGKTIYFNLETKESTHTQPFVLKSGDERHRVLFAEREAGMKKKALELESEIVKLKEQLQSVAQEKDQEIERLKRTKRGAGTDVQDDGDVDATASAAGKLTKKKGLLRRLFGGERDKKTRSAAQQAMTTDTPLTPEEVKKLALQRGLEAELPHVRDKLMTRERAAKEDKAKRTIGSKHFEQAMLDEFAKGS